MWSKFSYIGTCSSPVLILLFALAYCQLDKFITKKNIILLFITPVITILLAFTNEWHNWIWTGMKINPQTNIALYEHGPWFWVFSCYAYFNLFITIILFISARRQFPDYFKEQTITLIIASVFPLAGNIMYVFNINPVPGLEWTPIAFMLTGSILTFSIYKLHMFDLVPIARNNIINSMNNGIIIFDNKDRIVDLNPAMREILQQPAVELIGRLYMELPDPWKDMISSLYKKPDNHYDIQIPLSGKNIYFDLQLVTLHDRKQDKIARLYIFHDISKCKNLEIERESLIKELQGALAEVKTLSGLLPICANCKKIRDENGNWHQVESYMTKHSKAKFSHGICPECRTQLYPEFVDKNI